MRQRQQEIVYIGYTGGVGGEAMQMFELAAGVAEQGWPVTVVVPAMDGLRRFVDGYHGRPNITVRTTERIRFNTGAQNPVDVLALLWPYRHVALLHLHTGDICLPRITLAALDLLRPRNVIATIHSAEADMIADSPRARYWKNIATRRLRKVVCPSAHGQRTQRHYGLPAERTVTIYNGVDTTRYAAGNGSSVRTQLGIAPDTPLILFASRFHPQKRPVDVIQAFARIAAIRSDVHLAMVGAGPLQAEVETAVAALPVGRERVHLPGHQSNIPDWLAAATLYVLPSQRENFSLAIIEALAAGCAVVSTQCQGNDEILENRKNALTVPVGDVRTLAQMLLTALGDAELRARLGAAGRTTAAAFTRDAMVRQYLDLYRESWGTVGQEVTA
jgi:glycosyltransferase involved in cell wall biosynthesis